MTEATKPKLERPRLVTATSLILFISGIANIIDFITLYQAYGLATQSIMELVYTAILLGVGFIIFNMTRITYGILASLAVGIAAIMIQLTQHSLGISLVYDSVGPIVAGAMAYFARKQLHWLVERETPQFRELQFTWRMIKKNKISLVSIGVIIFFYVLSAAAPYVSPYDPLQLHLKNKLEGPTNQFLLGTDELGRDILSRLIWGTQVSMVSGLIVVVISVAIGLPLGSISGYLGGRVDELLMRTTDIFMAFPGLTLAMLMAYVLGRGLFSAIVGLSLVSWCITARLVRSVILSEKEKEYATAAKALGESDFKILFREILPNSLHPVIVSSMMSLGTTVISVAGLSFVGVGIQPPTADWGVMINTGRQFLMDQPLYATVPGILIIIVVLAFNIVGDSMRDALDPALRRQR